MKNGFTLAEVLITLGVVGIVAAMTMPAIVGKYKDQILITQSKKTYSTISNAFNLLKAESGYSDYSEIFENSSEQILSDLIKYIQVTQNCGAKPGCWAKGETKPQKNSGEGYNFYDSFGLAKAILLDGSTIGIMSYSTKYVGENCLRKFETGETDVNGNPTYKYSNQCGQIFFDSNGEKGPNQYGADTFSFIVTPEKFIQYQGDLYDAIIGNTLNYEIIN